MKSNIFMSNKVRRLSSLSIKSTPQARLEIILDISINNIAAKSVLILNELRELNMTKLVIAQS